MISFSDFFSIMFASTVDFLTVPVISYLLSFLGMSLLFLGLYKLVSFK